MSISSHHLLALVQSSLLYSTRKKLEAFRRSSIAAVGILPRRNGRWWPSSQHVCGADNGPSRLSVIDSRNSMCFVLPSPQMRLYAYSFSRYSRSVRQISPECRHHKRYSYCQRSLLFRNVPRVRRLVNISRFLLWRGLVVSRRTSWRAGRLRRGRPTRNTIYIYIYIYIYDIYVYDIFV